MTALLLLCLSAPAQEPPAVLAPGEPPALVARLLEPPAPPPPPPPPPATPPPEVPAHAHTPFTLDTPPVPPPAPPAAPPQSWRMRDVHGVWFTHADKAVLEDWMKAHNAVLEPRRVRRVNYQENYPSAQGYSTAPPVTYQAAPPMYYSAPMSYGSHFSGGGGCAGGNCR